MGILASGLDLTGLGRSRPVLALLIASACLPGIAAAQPVLCLRVEPADAGDPRFSLVEIDQATGLEAEIPDGLDRATWLYGLGDHGSHNYTALAPADRGTLHASELLGNSQAVLFGADLGERIVTMSAAEFTLLAARAGVEWTPAPAMTQVRVRRIEASKAIVRPTPARDEGAAAPSSANPGYPAGMWASPIVIAKRGERVEIRPLFDPTLLLAPSLLPVRVYVEGDGAGVSDVWATHLPTGATQHVRADGKAIANLSLEAAGTWRIEFHRAKPAPAGDPEADWVVYSATLTFENIGGVQ